MALLFRLGLAILARRYVAEIARPEQRSFEESRYDKTGKILVCNSGLMENGEWRKSDLYEYDKDNCLKQIKQIDKLEGIRYIGYEYECDEDNRLKQIRQIDESGGTGYIEYEYDLSGNKIRESTGYDGKKTSQKEFFYENGVLIRMKERDEAYELETRYCYYDSGLLKKEMTFLNGCENSYKICEYDKNNNLT